MLPIYIFFLIVALVLKVLTASFMVEMNFVRANEDMMWHSRYACSHVIMCVVVLNDFFCESKTFTKLKALTKISATTFCYCKETLQLQLTN